METTLLRPDALRQIADEQRKEKLRQEQELARKREAQQEELHSAFMNRHLEPDAERRFNHLVSEAAARGEHEIMVLRFPSDWCSDGGRAINNLQDEWAESLTGFAKELYDAYDARLRPLGYKIRAQVLDYPGGMPGDVGLFLGW